MRKGPKVRARSAPGRAKGPCDSPFLLLPEPLSSVTGTEHTSVTFTETCVNRSWAMDQNLPVATSLGPGTSVTGLVQSTLPSLLTCIWLHVTETLAHTAFPLKDVYTAPKEKPQVGLAAWVWASSSVLMSSVA